MPKIDRSAAKARQAQLSGFIEKLMEPQPLMTPREQAWSYIQELKQLILDDGGSKPVIFVQAVYGPNDIRNIGINVFGKEIRGGLFAEGGAE